jgi:hypothetical protein
MESILCAQKENVLNKYVKVSAIKRSPTIRCLDPEPLSRALRGSHSETSHAAHQKLLPQPRFQRRIIPCQLHKINQDIVTLCFNSLHIDVSEPRLDALVQFTLAFLAPIESMSVDIGRPRSRCRTEMFKKVPETIFAAATSRNIAHARSSHGPSQAYTGSHCCI